MWGIASATADANLIEACVPFIANNLASLKTNEQFLCCTEAESLKSLLASQYSECVAEEGKLKIISAWMNAPPAADVRENRVECFESLLQVLKLWKLSSTFMLDFAIGDIDYELPSTCRKKLQEAWKNEISANRYAPLFYGLDVNANSGILSKIPQKDESFRYRLHLPHRYGSGIVLLKGT